MLNNYRKTDYHCGPLLLRLSLTIWLWMCWLKKQGWLCQLVSLLIFCLVDACWMCALNCRNVVPLAYSSPPLAYNSPLAYPQAASTALPMEYGQGLYRTVDAFTSWSDGTLFAQMVHAWVLVVWSASIRDIWCGFSSCEEEKWGVLLV